MVGPDDWTRLTVAANGEALTASQSLEVHAYELMTYKPIRFKRAYLTGRFGRSYWRVPYLRRAALFALVTCLGAGFVATQLFAPAQDTDRKSVV